MKNRRTVIIAFLLCACVAIGAGYAALTDTLSITGNVYSGTSAAQPSFDAKVYFSDATEFAAECQASTENNVYGKGTSDPDTAFFDIYSLAMLGDYVTIDYEIKNDSAEYAAVLEVTGTTNSNEEFYDISYTWPDGNVVATESTTTLRVTISMLKSPDEPVEGFLTLTIGVTSQDSTPVTPET